MNDFRDSFDRPIDADGGLGSTRAEQVAWRGVSMLLVLAFAVQVGLGYARSDAFFRDSLAKPTFIRALAQSLATTAARPTRDTRVVPVRQNASRPLPRLDATERQTQDRADAGPRLLPRFELIALPPPLA